MRTITVNAYTISELSGRARDNALSQLAQQVDTDAWSEEELESLLAFISDITGSNQRSVKRELRSVCIDPETPRATAGAVVEKFTHACVRGLRLRSFDKEAMPTGYCADNNYRYPFHDEFKRTGSAWKAFEYALVEGLKSWAEDREYHRSEEALSEYADANGIEFDADGDII